MANDYESLHKLSDEEPKIPVLTVVKNGAILKNIFIVNNSDHDQLEREQILIVGRHPDCNIILTHPSISRFHLQILSNPSSYKLSVIDLSSVHGTRVSERKIDPWARVDLQEGDSLRFGGSSRIYKLHWIPLSHAYDFESPYVSASDAPLTEEKGEKVSMEAYQDENSSHIENEPVEEEENILSLEMKAQEEECDGNNSLFMENKEIQSLDLVVEGMSSLFSESLGITVKKEIPPAPPMPENSMCSPFDDGDDECIEGSLKDVDQQKEISSCNDGNFGTESGKPSLPFEGVILDNKCVKSGKDHWNPESSTVTKFECERECPESSSGGPEKEFACEEKSYLVAQALEETENQSLFTEDFGQTDKSPLLVGEVVGESENQHNDIKDLDPEALCALEWPSQKGKQENSKAFYNKGPPAFESLETEYQKLLQEDHEQKDVSVKDCEPCLKESVSSSFPAEEAVLEISDDKENQTPQSRIARLPRSETTGLSPLKSEKTPAVGSIWLRRGKPANVIHLQTGRSRGENAVSEFEQGNQDNMEDKSISKDILSCLDKEQDDIFTLDMKNFTPNTLLVKSLKKKCMLARVSQLRAGKRRDEAMPACADSEDVQHNQEDSEDKSISKNIFSCLGGVEAEIFMPNKENFTPNTLLAKSLKKKGKLVSVNQLRTSKSRGETMVDCVNSEYKPRGEENLEDKPISKEVFCCLNGEEEEVFTLNKENFTPNTLLLKSLQKEDKLVSVSQLRTCKSRVKESILASAYSECEQHNQEAPEDELISKEVLSCFNGEEEETFTLDKENLTPNTLLLKSLMKKGKLEEAKHSKWCRSSSPRLIFSPNMHPEKDLIASLNKENTLGVLQEWKPLKQPICGNQARLKQEPMDNKRRQERVPFQSLVVNSIGKTRSETLGHSYTSKSSSSASYTQNAEKITNPLSSNAIREGKRSWTMVADATTLLNKESRKSLQLLQGLRGTRLIIPRMVIRELDCLKRCGSLFRRKTEACLVLEWIEQCMVEKSWWIHVQSSAEDRRLTAPTPPTSPRSPCSQGSGGFCYGATSTLPFLRHGNLMEIVSPTTEDHILECSLLCRKTMSDGRLVLLSGDITLKIKAMAEGLICETVQEFRESLMNPFSERFLWVDSSPRGQTWSVLDDVVLREKYSRFPLKKSLKGESAKGLKLILLHNSHYGQRSLMS